MACKLNGNVTCYGNSNGTAIGNTCVYVKKGMIVRHDGDITTNGYFYPIK